MKSRTPTADRLLAIIRQRGRITSADLAAETGVKSGNQCNTLAAAIAAGTVRHELARRGDGSGRRHIVWIWSAGQAAAPVKLRGAARRRCLACGEEFASAGPMNRICPRCAGVNARAGSGPFDIPAVIRYR